METNRFRLAAVALAFAAPVALAQDVGFFRPAADPALTSTRPQAPQPPAAPQVPESPVIITLGVSAEVIARRSAVPDTGKVVISLMRNRRRVTGAPVLLMIRRRMVIVPKVA